MPADYQEELDAITDELVHMTNLVGSAINLATQALLDADLQAAESVIEGDEVVDALAAEIDGHCLELGALLRPVPVDLRIVMSAVRMSMSVERMGDLAKHVAKQTRLRYPKSSVPPELRGTFSQMGGLAEAIVSKTGLMILSQDLSHIAAIQGFDDRMDELHRELFMTVLAPSWPHGVEEAIDVTLLSRFYERFADHAVTVSKRMVHIVTGLPYAEVSAEDATTLPLGGERAE